MKKPAATVMFVAACIFVAGCSSTTSPQINTQSLYQLQCLNAKQANSADNKANYIRTLGLQNTAMTLGAQGGLSWRATQIDRELSQNATQLDQIFNFNGLMLDHSVLPPVLVEGDNTLNLADPETIRISDVNYRIKQQARFVTAAPTWRDYIWLDYPAPAVPNSALLPKTDQEQQIWQHYVTLGWKEGVQQANTIYGQNLGRLKQDYNGMILYRKLLAQRMVSAPYVATTDMGVTGDATQLNIHDQVLRITALPQMQDNSQKWNPVVVE